jgi:hypothetical protein
MQHLHHIHRRIPKNETTQLIGVGGPSLVEAAYLSKWMSKTIASQIEMKHRFIKFEFVPELALDIKRPTLYWAKFPWLNKYPKRIPVFRCHFGRRGSRYQFPIWQKARFSRRGDDVPSTFGLVTWFWKNFFGLSLRSKHLLYHRASMFDLKYIFDPLSKKRFPSSDQIVIKLSDWSFRGCMKLHLKFRDLCGREELKGVSELKAITYQAFN